MPLLVKAGSNRPLRPLSDFRHIPVSEAGTLFIYEVVALGEKISDQPAL